MNSTIPTQIDLPVVLHHSEVWRGEHQGVHFKIHHWGKDLSSYEGRGNWCYYIYFGESVTPDFEQMWLPDRLVQITPESKGFVTNDYYDLRASGVNWHGGVTYYAKHGSMIGHRCVEMGCDYAHLYDYERGYDYDLREVLGDCMRTIEELVERQLIAPSDPNGPKGSDVAGVSSKNPAVSSSQGSSRTAGDSLNKRGQP